MLVVVSVDEGFLGYNNYTYIRCLTLLLLMKASWGTTNIHTYIACRCFCWWRLLGVQQIYIHTLLVVVSVDEGILGYNKYTYIHTLLVVVSVDEGFLGYNKYTYIRCLSLFLLMKASWGSRNIHTYVACHCFCWWRLLGVQQIYIHMLLVVVSVDEGFLGFNKYTYIRCLSLFLLMKASWGTTNIHTYVACRCFCWWRLLGVQQIYIHTYVACRCFCWWRLLGVQQIYIHTLLVVVSVDEGFLGYNNYTYIRCLTLLLLMKASWGTTNIHTYVAWRCCCWWRLLGGITNKQTNKHTYIHTLLEVVAVDEGLTESVQVW